jgi:excisionase family DNA binding protein
VPTSGKKVALTQRSQFECFHLFGRWPKRDIQIFALLGDAMTSRAVDADPLLTPAEVAQLFRVDPKTVTRWAKAGKLTSVRTLGGHRRYRESEVRNLLGEAESVS